MLEGLAVCVFGFFRGEGERVMALESREGTRASRRVEEGLSSSFSGHCIKPRVPLTCACDLRELLRVPLSFSFSKENELQNNLALRYLSLTSLGAMGFNKHLLSFRIQGNKACICIVTMAPRLGWLSARAFLASHPLLYLKVVLLSTQELEKRAWLGMESLSEWK